MSPTPNPLFNAAGKLAEELDVVGKSQTVEPPVTVALNTFAEVSQIAEEAVIDATQ